MSTLFYRDRRLFALAILMILAAGSSALLSLGRQEDPTITNLFATIVTPFPGADPARVEALVTEKIEEELREIPEIDEIKSVSRLGISVISVELSQFITDRQIEQTWSEIRDALDDAARNLPAGAAEPVFDNDRTGAFTNIVALRAAPDLQVPDAILSRFANALQDRLRAVSGTKQVEVYGAREEEVRVSIDPVRLLSLGLTASDVSAAIAQADAKVRAGQVRGDSNDVILEVAGELKALNHIYSVPLIEGADGRIVRVGDIATIEKTVLEPAETLALKGGRPAVLVAAKMEDDLQVDAWAARITTTQDRFAETLPSGLELVPLFDQAAYTEARLAGVLENMAVGIALVVGVLILSLGLRAAMIVALVIPLAAVLSLFGLQLLAIPIHQMSMTGLIVALGLLVDGAIVMTDEVRKRLAAGASRQDAVDLAVRRLIGPLLASTVTTVLAFMPMALLPGPAGDFVGSIALAVITMLFTSLVLALTLTPALSGWFLSNTTSHRRNWLLDGWEFGALGSAFSVALRVSLRRPLVSIVAALALPVIGFAAFPTLKPQFFPGVDRDQLYVQVQLPEGTAISRTEHVVRRIDQVLNTQDQITGVTWVLGASAPAFYYNMQANQDGVASFAEALITTQSTAATEALIDPLQAEFDRLVPEARVIVRGLVQGPPVNAPVEIRVVGPDLTELRRIGDDIRRIMLDVPGITLARTELGAGSPKLRLELQEDRVRLSGLNLVSVAGQLDSQLEGVTGGSIVEGSEELPVRVRVVDSARNSLGSIDTIDIAAPAARATAAVGAYPGIPLDALGDMVLVPAQSAINRRNGERINTVQAFVQRDILPEAALQALQAELANVDLALPNGYRLETGGDSDTRDETLTNLLSAMGLILAITVATIVLTFGSYRLAALTAVVAVLSMGLSLLALAVFAYPFGIQGVIGVIGSIGVSINAAIIILTALQSDAAARAGNVDAIAAKVAAQGRHIVSTTVTTFGGFLPLILEGGGFWPPFAMAIAGGVLLSIVVSFLFVPHAFLLLSRFGQVPSGERNSTTEQPAVGRNQGATALAT